MDQALVEARVLDAMASGTATPEQIEEFDRLRISNKQNIDQQSLESEDHDE